jgi:hypothetical protein
LGGFDLDVAVEEAGELEGGSGGEASDCDGLDCTLEDVGAEGAAFGSSEESEGDQCDDDRNTEGGGDVGEDHVGGEGDDAAGDIGEGDGEGGADGAARGGLFEAEFEAHHEIHVGFGVGLEGTKDGGGGFVIDAVLFEDFVDFRGFVCRAGDDFVFFAAALGGEVLCVTARGEIAAEAHGDRAGGDFSEAGGNDEMGGGDGSGEARGEGEGDGEAVGQADDDVPDHFRGVEMDLVVIVRGRWRGFRCIGGHSVSVEGRDVGWLLRKRNFMGSGRVL